MKTKLKTTLALLAAFCGLQLFTATPAQAATTITGAKWGNIGSSAGGVVTSNGGNFGYDDWTLNFSDSSGMYDKQIGGSGKVCIKRIVLVDRPDASTSRRHSKITLTQGSLVVEATPVYHAAGTDGISIYDTSGQPTTGSSKTVFGWYEYVLTDNTVEFDASMNIAIKLTSPTSDGSGVCAVKPINNILVHNGWSPAIEITADWTPTRVVSYSVAQCWGSSTTGLLTGEKYATSAGVIPLAGWSQPVTGASDTTVRSDSKGSTLTISKYWDGSAKTFSGVSGFTFASYISGGTNLYGPSGSPTTFDDYRTCVNQALNCNDTGTPNDTITISNIPFESYDVIVYFAGGNKKGTTYTMNSVQVNSGNYYKPNSTTPGDNAISSSDSTWGNSTSSDLIYGTNVMRINGVVGQSLVLGQRCLAYGIAAIQIVERIAYKATFNTDKTFSGLEWTPSKPASGFGPSDVLIINNTAAAKLTIDQDVKVGTFAIQNESGKALTLGFDGHSINAAFDKSAASGGVTIDVSGDWGAEIAKYAVTGAPYSYWYIYGTGDLPNEPTTMPTMPTGYSAASQKYTDYGMRLVVTAPTTAKFGAVSVNLYKDVKLSTGSTLSGAYPVAHDNWGNLKAAANESATVDGVTFTMGSTASGYYINTYSDEIYRQYMDDSSTTRTISLSGISYAKYRIIVYFSTDTANSNFRPVIVNDGTSDVAYSGPETGTTAGYTLKGRNDTWGHTGPDKGMNAVAEGVNYLVTDVMTTTSPVLKFTRNGGTGPRATPCAIQIVEVGVPVSYKATVTEDGENWSELGWTPDIPSSGMPSWSDCVITNGRDADVTTVNMDSTVSVGKFTVVSATKVLKFGSPSRLTATTYDFSQAPGGVGFGVTGGWDFPETLRNYLRDNNVKAVFYTDNATGVTVDYGTSSYDNNTVKGHFVFNGGTHTFQKSSESAGLLFGANATAENPTLWVKDNTTLNFKMRNPCGWNSSGGTGGIIRMGNGATVSAQNSASGTWYWSQQFYFDPGSTLNIVTANFRVVGSDEKAKAQFYMPSSDGGTATISSANATTYLHIGDNDYSKMAFDVGAGSTLEVTAPLKTLTDSKNFKKYGLGTLKLSGGLVDFKPTASVEGGVLEIATETDFKSGTTMAVASGATLKFGAVSGTFANVISGAGALVKDGTGTTTTLTGANTYSGGTTVTAGTLKVAEGASIGSGNYSVAAGATLNLPSTFRPTDAKLIGTSAGTVGITLTAEELASFEGKNEVSLIGIDGSEFSGTVKIYDLSGSEYLNTVAVKDGKICVTKVDQKVSPFHVTNPASGNWTAAAWRDSSSPEKDVEESDWAIKVSANLAVEAENTSALTVNRLIQLGTFNVNNAGTLTVTATDNALTADTLAPVNTGNLTLTGNITVTGAIDDSANTGTTTLDFPTHAANITAGANTIVRGGGTGALTIGAGKMATVKDGLWAGTIPSPTATSTLKFAGTTELATVPYTDNNSFAGTVVYAAPFANQETIGFNGNMTREFDSGLDLTVTKNIQFGNGSGVTQTFNQRGGAITVTGNAEPTSTSAAVLFAHWDGKVYYNLSGGTFTAENAAIRFGWDGKVYFTLNDGTFRTKGIKSGGERNKAASFTMNGGTLELGDFGIQGLPRSGESTVNAAYTFSGGTVRAYANTQISVAHADGLQVTGNVTFDVGTYTLTLPGKVSGSGNITVTGTGTLVLSGDASSYTGVLTVPAGMTVKASESWLTDGKLSFADTTCNLVMYDKTSYDGRFTMTLAEGSATPASITVKSSADESHDYGTVTVTGTAPNVTVSYTPWVDGKGALYAWEFNGNLKSTGRTNSDMGQDHGPFYTDDKTRVYAYSQPHNGLTWPTEFTTAIACTLPTNANVCLVGWGQATPGGIALTSGDVSKHEVKMVYWQNNQKYTELATMTVPNAFESEHLYLFAKTADGVKVYLDGSLVVNYSGALSLGVGVQVGTVYQGVGQTGLVRLDTVYSGTNDCKSAVNTLRIYDAVLGPNSIAELKAEFPYTSPKGTYTRALTGTENAWNETEKWTRTKEGEEPSLVSVPAADATVVLTAKDEATIANNLTASAAYEAINLSGEGTITITAADDNTNKITSAGSVQIGANAVVKYSAIDLGNTPIEIMTGKKLTIDASMIDVTKYFTTTVIPLTGLVTAADDEATQLKILPPTAAEGSGRTVSVAKSASEHIWEVTITVEPKPFVYTVAQGSETGTWTWGTQTVTAEQVAAQTTGEIQKAGNGTATLTPQAGMTYTVNTDGGTLKFGSELIRGMNVTVNQGGVFDLNGLKAKEMNLTLAGGKVTNSSSEALSEGDQIKTITLTADSTIEVPNAYQVYAQGYTTATTITLNNFTLTKTGSAQLKLVNTDITGTGTFLVNEGTVFNGETSRFAEGVTLSIGASGTWEQRDGDRKTNVSKVSGTEGGTLNIAGKISGFELSGTLNLTGNGSYGTITNQASAVAKVGNRRNLTFAGAGTVDVTLTDAEYAPGAEITAFTLASTDPAPTTKVGKIFYPAGTEVTSRAYIEGNKITIKKEAKIGSTYYIVLADALDAAEANATVTLCTNVTGFAYTLGKNLTLDGDNYVINGSGFTGSGKLTIAAGFIGVTSLPTSYSLIGGKYTSNSTWQAETGYHYVVIANTGDMLYQIVKSGDTPAPEDEKAYVVTGGTIAASESDLVSKGYITKGDDVQEFLNTNGDNGIPNWKNVTLGLSNTVATDVPYPAPVQSAEANKVSLKLGSNVVVDKGSGATVTYKVKTRTDSEWTTLPTEYGYGDTAEVNLPESGVQYYKFDVIVTPAK